MIREGNAVEAALGHMADGAASAVFEYDLGGFEGMTPDIFQLGKSGQRNPVHGINQ